jgi:3-oxoacyl-[acyl-carrier protein] reductase
MPSASNRIVWITGASSGIGRALAVEYATCAFTAILSGRNKTLLNSLKKSIVDNGGKAHVFVCDVRNAGSVQEIAKEIVGSIGTPDILVNNAGVTVFKEFLNTSVEEFDDIVSTNLRGSFLTTKAILPSMIKRRNGIVLNVVSYAAKTTYTASSAYAASKAGLAAMMDGLRAEVRNHGIKIVNVFPGAVLTPIWSSKVRAKYGKKMLTTQEAAKMIYSVSCQPQSMMVEELVIRPQTGDINE